MKKLLFAFLTAFFLGFPGEGQGRLCVESKKPFANATDSLRRAIGEKIVIWGRVDSVIVFEGSTTLELISDSVLDPRHHPKFGGMRFRPRPDHILRKFFVTAFYQGYRYRMDFSRKWDDGNPCLAEDEPSAGDSIPIVSNPEGWFPFIEPILNFRNFLGYRIVPAKKKPFAVLKNP